MIKNKKWLLREYDCRRVDELAESLQTNKIIAALLYSRGICDKSTVSDFFDSSIQILHSPFLLDGMKKAVDVINAAIADRKKIAVYGDYDVDGMTSTAVLVDYLRSRGADCIYYIPDRLTEGYGVNNNAIDFLKAQGTDLIITVDTGITAIEEAEYAKKLGIDMVITDHHECRKIIPDALAVVNPHKPQPEPLYPFASLAGVGVVFKLITALNGENSSNKLLEKYGDLVAIGTVADVMPLIDENRFIVTQGLRLLENTKNPGLKILMELADACKKRITSTTISYNLAPKINAAGRMGDANLSVELFLADTAERALELAQYLCEKNRERQDEEQKIMRDIEQRIKNEFNPETDKVIVMWGENWHNGVIGIVASKLMEKYNVPTILISISNGEGKGSGRSIDGINLYEAIVSTADLLGRFGGHEMAAGLTIKTENLAVFKKRISDYIDKLIPVCGQEKILQIDCELSECDINLNLAEQLSVLEPFGAGNSQPVFCMRDVFVDDAISLKQDKHVKLILKKGTKVFQALLFGAGRAECPVTKGELADVAFYLDINEFRGSRSIQFIVQDIKIAESLSNRAQADIKIYNKFKNGEFITGEQATGLIPPRQEFVDVFKHIKNNARDSVFSAEYHRLYRDVCISNRSIPISRMMICLDVFDELNIFSVAKNEQNLNIKVIDVKNKVDISTSKILADIKRHI